VTTPKGKMEKNLQLREIFGGIEDVQRLALLKALVKWHTSCRRDPNGLQVKKVVREGVLSKWCGQPKKRQGASWLPKKKNLEGKGSRGAVKRDNQRRQGPVPKNFVEKGKNRKV